MSDPIVVNLTLDLDKHLARYAGYDADGEPVQEPTTIEDVVLHMATREFVQSLDRDVKSEVGRRVREIRDEEIRRQVAPLIEEAIAKSVQETDSYGNPKGEPRTMAEIIVAEAKTALSKPKDPYARNKGTLVEEFVRAEVAAAFTKELKQAADAAKAEVLAAVKERGAEVLASTISAMASR